MSREMITGVLFAAISSANAGRSMTADSDMDASFGYSSIEGGACRRVVSASLQAPGSFADSSPRMGTAGHAGHATGDQSSDRGGRKLHDRAAAVSSRSG